MLDQSEDAGDDCLVLGPSHLHHLYCCLLHNILILYVRKKPLCPSLHANTENKKSLNSGPKKIHSKRFSELLERKRKNIFTFVFLTHVLLFKIIMITVHHSFSIFKVFYWALGVSLFATAIIFLFMWY